jgi:excisionase family DNA binding protein
MVRGPGLNKAERKMALVMSTRKSKCDAKRLSVADGEEVWTVRDLARYLRCHTSTLYRLVQRCEIPHFRLGTDIRFRRSLIKQWLDKQSKGA